VHTRRLAGCVVHDGDGDDGGGGERVEWDLTRGSYDDLLARRAARPAAAPEAEPA
jgi:hypothetical protein